MHFYSVESVYGDNRCVWLSHDWLFSREEWLAFVRRAVESINGKVTTEKIVAYLCREHGFSVTEPLYSVWVDLGLTLHGGEAHLDDTGNFKSGRTRYVEVASHDTVAQQREKRDLRALCKEKAKYQIGQRVRTGEMEKPPVADDGLTFCWTQNRTGVVKARNLREIDAEVEYHIIFDDFQCEKCWVQCWIPESDLSPES